MNWIKIAAWAYGFITPALFVGYVVGAISLAVGYFSLWERFGLPVKEIWSGVFLFAALAVLSGVIFAQFIK